MLTKTTKQSAALLAVVLLSSVVQAAQQNIDPEFIAFAKIPGPTRNSPSFYLLISEGKCPQKEAPPGWKKGMYLYSTGKESACWSFAEDNIKFCPTGQYETTYKNTDYGTVTVSPCHVWPKNEFYKR